MGDLAKDSANSVLNQPKIWLIIPSAGSGERMQSAVPKQYLQIKGRAILDRTLDLMLAQKRLSEIVVCLASEDQYWCSLDNSDHPRVSTTLGGGTRAQSVARGIQALSDRASENDWLMVHDAARPCLAVAVLSSFIETLEDHPTGGLLALASKDTIKYADSKRLTEVKKTLPRERIWLAQTPQMFRYGLLKRALFEALDAEHEVTDEASAMEYAGHRVELIAGDVRNIKLTTPEDMQLAQCLLESSENAH